MGNFRFDASKLIQGLAEREIKLRASLNLYGDTVAKKMEAYAKSNRRWQDRTGDARKRLKGNSEPWGNGVRVSISHNVSYGVYLEMCNERRYAILKPTVDKIAPEAVKGLSNLLK